MMEKTSYSYWSGVVSAEIENVLKSIDEKQVDAYLDILHNGKRIFFIGVGRVLLALEAIAKRYAHLGLDCVIVGQITEPAITPDDVLVVGSGSGNTLIPAAISKKAKSLGAVVVQIGCDPEGQVGQIADLFIRIPSQSKRHMEDEIPSIQPMTSLFEQSLLLFGDITAAMMMEKFGYDPQGMWQFHANLE